MSYQIWSPGMTLEHIERLAIEEAFKFYRGNKSQTARVLDISIRTLESKIERYEEDDKRIIAEADARRSQSEALQRFTRGAASIPDQGKGAEGDEIRSAPNGVSLESPARTPAEYAVSVPVREKVQGMLPAGNAGGGARKNR